LRRHAAKLEEAQEVIILPVHITDDANRGVELQQHGLLHEDLLHSRAYFLDFVLRELGLVALAEFEQPLQAVVQLGSTKISAARGGHVNALRRV